MVPNPSKSCLLHSEKKISCTVCMIYHLKSEAQTRHSVRYPFSIRLIDKLFQCQSQQLKNRRWMYRIFLCLETPAEGQQVKNTSKNGWWFRRENHLGSTSTGWRDFWTMNSYQEPSTSQESTKINLFNLGCDQPDSEQWEYQRSSVQRKDWLQWLQVGWTI